MDSNDIYTRIQATKTVLQELQAFLLTYEGRLDEKEAQLRILDGKIAAKKAENSQAESKASLVLAKASEEASQIRKQAQDMLEASRTEFIVAKDLMRQAQTAIAEAKARSAKVEADEKAFNANSIILERKKQALESALHVG